MKIVFDNPLITNEFGTTISFYINKCKQVIDSSNYSAPEASLCLPSDNKILTQIEDLAKKKQTKELRYVIVIGIGGSNLGSQAVYNALYGNTDTYNPHRIPKMIFLDTIDAKLNNAFLTFFESRVSSENEFIISLISKSGSTTEPLAIAEIMFERLQNKFPNWKNRCVFITDENSHLWNEGRRLGIDTLAVPKMVGGRYSVFSPVGLFPLAMAHINIQSLLKGAEKMRDRCILDSSENDARNSAVFQYYFLKKGRAIHNSFFFNPELECLGKWYRQLMGESIGKDRKGITPLVSIGSVDHHSMVQLYWGGPQDKTTEIIYSMQSENCIIPSNPIFPTLTTMNGMNTSCIQSAIQKATSLTYKKLEEPYFEVSFNKIDEYELGQYMQYKMMEIMYLGNLMEINTFNQPQVELYKSETKNILAKKDI